MADKIAKFFRKLSPKEREKILGILRMVRGREIVGLDIKKIKGHDHLYRLRVGRVRVIYLDNGDHFELKFAGFRDDQTYRDF